MSTGRCIAKAAISIVAAMVFSPVLMFVMLASPAFVSIESVLVIVVEA